MLCYLKFTLFVGLHIVLKINPEMGIKLKGSNLPNATLVKQSLSMQYSYHMDYGSEPKVESVTGYGKVC